MNIQIGDIYTERFNKQKYEVVYYTYLGETGGEVEILRIMLNPLDESGETVVVTTESLEKFFKKVEGDN